MLLQILLGFLCGIAAQQDPPPPLLLVSFDGFRAEYLQRFPMPNLKLLYDRGVLVEELTNVFVTKTFPNHYSLVTGLHSESHGIVANVMYDQVSKQHFNVGKKNDPWWWNEAEPLWVTALNSGYKTAAMMWPGSDVAIRNRTPTHFMPYDSGMTFRQRLGTVTRWILGDGKEEGVKFTALYWEEPDRSGHKYGPDNTTAMAKVLKEVDDNIGLLVLELKQTGLWGHINVLIASDHGMTQCSAERVVRLDDCIHPDNYTLVDLAPVTAIIPHTDPGAIVEQLNKCHTHIRAYLKEDIPERFHYRNNRRIPPVIVVADEGWTILQRGNKFEHLGNHGYDNALASMHPFLAGTGPSLRQGYRISSLKSVDIYPLMCRLLWVPPLPNNGTLSHARCLLAVENCWEAGLSVLLIVGLLMLVMAVASKSYRIQGDLG
ncbi:bis(5'-adenosyl)-triphosphatase enpp4 isoform X2 [Notolabrus celidotus]|uniref:bis(5'-adenosyl)-triphosphatase enpp4 isoform X2 n=1 Tax=Notolabrus celidotus TaxID=1203425 RepID=UPI00148F939F|nr:bis(5'-adenosyl)-triphosphatase enpp4 isoform X2 [Notolabrus celidotus]